MIVLCVIGLVVALGIIFIGIIPLAMTLLSIAFFKSDNLQDDGYWRCLLTSLIILILIISELFVNFYFDPETFGYQKIVSENCVESEENK